MCVPCTMYYSHLWAVKRASQNPESIADVHMKKDSRPILRFVIFIETRFSIRRSAIIANRFEGWKPQKILYILSLLRRAQHFFTSMIVMVANHIFEKMLSIGNSKKGSFQSTIHPSITLRYVPHQTTCPDQMLNVVENKTINTLRSVPCMAT